MKQLAESFAELSAIEQLASRCTNVETLTRVGNLPIHAFHFGPDDPSIPCLLVTGGVHGVEKIGTHVAVAFLGSLVSRLAWDDLLHDALHRVRVKIVPLVNPTGMALDRRSNANGVDLMRNAPATHALGGTPLLGGQRISPHLPWYMGRGELEPESRALVSFVERSLFATRFSIAVDLHSGYGFTDRLWYPYARTREPPPDLAKIEALARLLDDTHPNHVYTIEQTAQAYTIRGDLWDYLYDRRRDAGPGTLLPLTLEMGSWSWVRKNPLQGLSTLGRFNPTKPHRLKRTLRRHIPLLDFLMRATASHANWCR
jgi:hypothetical protein